MLRFIVINIALFCTSIAFAQTNTSYIQPHPFSSFADSYQYSIQKLYESLPLITNTRNIPGTRALAEAELRNNISGNINITMSEWFNNLTPIGAHTIEVRRAKTGHYFWCIYGRVQFFYNNVNTRDAPVRTVRNYCLILHFKPGNAKANIDFFTIWLAHK